MYKMKQEFGGYGHTVPRWVAILVEKEILHDTSWHNDVCPSFEPDEEDSGVRLWVDHITAEERECPTMRFCITIEDLKGGEAEDEDACVTDDALILSEVLFKTDYDTATGKYYVRLIGGTKKIETGFNDEVSAMLWIVDFIKTNMVEVDDVQPHK